MEENKAKMDNNEIKELSDDDLKEVAGGKNFDNHYVDTEEQVVFIFPRGCTIRVDEGIFYSEILCTVERHQAFYDPQFGGYTDMYIVRGPDNLLRKILRDDVVNEAF